MKERPNNILGYPSIHLYKDGLFLSEFNGDRTSDKLKEFLKIHVPKQFRWVSHDLGPLL